MPIDTPSEGRFAVLCGIEDLKWIYRALFATLRPDPSTGMDESDLLIDIQTVLQREAVRAGVDVSDHSQWERFLGTAAPVPCEQRYAAYDEKKRNL
jgi:hypothetical protein